MNTSSYDFNSAPGLPTRDLRADRRRLALPALGVTAITLLTLVAQLILVIPVRLFAPQLVDQPWFLVIFSTAPMYLIAMPLSLLIFRRVKADPPRQQHLGILTLLGLLALCFALTYVGNFIGVLVNAMIERLTGVVQINDLEALTMQTPLWANLLFAGIFAPILEEIFYRKLIIDRWRAFGDLPAVLLSGLLFGLIHGNFSQFFYAAMIGMILGYVYLRTGRLRYTVFLHMGINLIGGVYTTEVMKQLDLDSLAADPLTYIAQNPLPVCLFAAYFCFIMLCFVVTPIVIALLWRKIHFVKAEPRVTAQHWRRILLQNPAIWFTLAIIVIMFLFS